MPNLTTRQQKQRVWMKYYTRIYVRIDDDRRLQRIAKRKKTSVINLLTQMIQLYDYVDMDRKVRKDGLHGYVRRDGDQTTDYSSDGIGSGFLPDDKETLG